MLSLVLPDPSHRGSRLALGTAALLFSLFVGAVAPVLAHDSAAGSAAVTITIRSGLSDRDVRVRAGDIVRFVNRDGERHRMRSRSGPGEFDTGNLEPGEAYQVRLSVAGTYAYLDERDDDAAAYRGQIVVGSGGGTKSTAASSGGVASSATVSIGDDFYQPTSIRIAVGGTVTFRNAGGDEHSATSSGFDTGVLSGGASVRKTFKAPGTFAFLCVFHSDMRGTVEVVAAGAGGFAPAPVAPKPTPTPAPTPVPAGASSGGQEGVAATPASVDVADFSFGPAAVEIAAGGSVEWTNTGVAPHTVTAKDGTFDSGMLEPGRTFRQTFAEPGSYAYVCAVHPDMVGTVRVVTASAGSAGGVPAAAPIAEAPTDSTDAAPTADSSSSAGIVLTVTLVSVAAALFSRAIRGTIRTPE